MEANLAISVEIHLKNGKYRGKLWKLIHVFMANIRHKEKKLLFNLSNRQRDILIGSLLGDANAHQKGNECRMFFKHAANQLPLLVWKRQEFESITGMAINRFKQKVKGRWYEFGQFVTLTHSLFTELRKMFYRGRKKIVPKNI